MQHTLIAVFDNRGDAQAAKDELFAAGFAGASIRQNDSSSTGGMAGSASSAGMSGAATGTGAGDASDEGFGAGIRHFFADLFGGDDQDQSSRYADAVTRGQHVLTLVTQSEQEVERAADIVERHGPVDIDEEAGGQFVSGGQSLSGGAGMSAQSGMQGTAQGGTVQDGIVAPAGGSLMGQQPQTGSNAQGGAMQGSQQLAQGEAGGTVLPVIEEELRVGKRQVQRGGVRIFQRVVETPVSETVNLREEHVSVERRPVDQPVSATDLASFQEKSIELREMAEEPVVEKAARVVEEVVVGKQVTETSQEIADTVRRTEVDVEQLSGSTGSTGSTGMTGMTGMTGSTGMADIRTSSAMESTGTASASPGMGGASMGMDGATAGAAAGSGMMGMDDNDYFRKHYDANYGTSGRSYQDYMPAYSYGSTMAATDNYRGRAWNDVEPSLRQDWESRNPGSAWDNFKAAIQHGWQKITG